MSIYKKVNDEECRLLGYYAVCLLEEPKKEGVASVIKATRIGDLGKTLVVINNRRKLRRKEQR
jgi:hypothetical protein